VAVALCAAAAPATNPAIATVNAAMQIRRKARHNSSAAPDRCCAAHADDANSHQTNRVACIGHSRGDDMVAQLRIFWCKAQTKVSIKVNVLAPERSGSRRRDLSSTR
jgi:hypothetical protein